MLDNSGEQTFREVKQFCSNKGTAMRALETGTPWANCAELCICLMKEAVCKDVREADLPLAFWDCCVKRRARVHNLTAKDMFQLRGTNPHAALTKEDGDVSNLCQCKWCNWCCYGDDSNSFPFRKEVLGQVLGSARGEGNAMLQWMLKANG